MLSWQNIGKIKYAFFYYKSHKTIILINLSSLNKNMYNHLYYPVLVMIFH